MKGLVDHRKIGKHLNCVLELYEVCSHFVFLYIFHSVFMFLCFVSTMKMPFTAGRCLESTVFIQEFLLA